MFGRAHIPSETHVELTVPPHLYESLQDEGVDIADLMPSLLAAILSAAVGAGRGGAVEVSVTA